MSPLWGQTTGIFPDQERENTIIQNMDNELLYCYTRANTEEAYVQLAKDVPSAVFVPMLLNQYLYYIIICFVVAMVTGDRGLSLSIFGFCLVFGTLMELVVKTWHAKKIYRKRKAKGIISDPSYYRFYDDHVDVVSEPSTYHLKYEELKKVKETDRYYYLLSNKVIKLYLQIDKEQASEELMAFVRSKTK
ncbi:hypothetical protein SAMN02910456_00448 [Ruminococcaceae bacterium YRB3002]|nr:hypothetical protein SAMN02910456_00448 [Ruminococcaceae bacterium YRB3002]